MAKIILATGSPYRQKAFSLLGLDFIAKESKVNEHFKGRPTNPKMLVKKLARLKAEAVARNHSQGIVIGFDSVGVFGGLILEKPKSKKQAFERLKAMSGKKHRFCTGIYLINLDKNKCFSRVVKTEIWLRRLEGWEIKKYLDQDPSFKTYALGYDSLGHYSTSFAKKIEGSYNNYLRGIPLEVVVDLLKKTGYQA